MTLSPQPADCETIDLRESPPVTIVMPTYERPAYLAEALESALDQSFGDFVILIGDNSERDDTERLVAGYDDERIHYHSNRPGLGPIVNWLDLIRRARSPLIATLHDDDRWLPEFLNQVVPPMLADPGIAMTFTDFWLIDADGRRLVGYSDAESERTRRDRLPDGPLDLGYEDGLRLVAVWNAPQPLYAAVARRDALMACPFDTSSMCPDLWFSYHLVKQRATMHYLGKRLTEYRIHPGAATSIGFHDSEDTVFATIVAENEDLDVAGEIAGYWASLRWSRATRLLGGGVEAKVRSQQEFLAAAAALGGSRKVLAEAAGRSAAAWEVLSNARAARLRFRPRATDVRYR